MDSPFVKSIECCFHLYELILPPMIAPKATPQEKTVNPVGTPSEKQNLDKKYMGRDIIVDDHMME